MSLMFNPLYCAQRNLRRFLSAEKPRVFACLLVALLAFKLAFGALALAGFLMWVSICFLVFCRQRLKTRYIASLTGNGLKFAKADSLFSYEIGWDKISFLKLEDSGADSAFHLKLKDGSAGFLQSNIHQELIDSSNSIVVSSENNPAFQDFVAGIKENIPVALSSMWQCPESEKIQQQAISLDDEASASQCLLPYKPAPLFQRSLSKFLSVNEKLLMLLFALVSLACVAGLGAKLAFSMMAFPVVIGMLVLLFAKEKILLELSKNGITLFFEYPGGRNSSRTVRWDEIYSVAAVTVGKKHESEALKFSWKVDPVQRNAFKWLCRLSPKIMKKQGDDFSMTLRVDGFRESKSKLQLLRFLLKYMPPEALEDKVRDMLNPTDPASYTKLWLDSLGSNAVRQFDGKLEEGYQLNNGKFEILDFLGAGGQASVYLARDRQARDSEPPELVLKEFILPSHAGADLSVRSLEHVQKELELMRKLSHEHIVQYYGMFVEDHRCYLILEHVSGRSLRKLVDDEGPLAQTQVIMLAEQMCDILEHLHGQDPPVVHRDFTPENLMLDNSGNLKLIDFNLAQELEENATRSIVGKHGYLPPEQFRGKACPQSDIYAMGATLYFLLTGEEPEPISSSHPILKDQSISRELDELLAFATEPELAERCKSASAFREGLACVSEKLCDNDRDIDYYETPLTVSQQG